ncbi:MAG: XrtY-associated glycosyltransferase XYAG1 [Sphingobacteriales bacterium]
MQICAAYKPAYIYGGPTMSVSTLSEELVKAGVDVTVFTTTANGREELSVLPGRVIDVEGVPVIYFKRITKDHSHFSPFLLKKLWKRAADFDLVHIHAWWNLVSVFSCWIALMRNVPVLLSPRGTLSPYSFGNKNIGIKWFIHNMFGRYLLNRCHVHTTSLRETEAIAKLIDPKSITTVPNFVKLPGIEMVAASRANDNLKLLFFSRIEEKKGLDVLLNALPHVTVPYHLTIAGSGDDDYINSLKKLVETNHLQQKVSWAGFHTENKFQFIDEHDLFILPSYDENFGNAVIESLSVGTPVLISREVGLADYVERKHLGWICQTTAVSVASAINAIGSECRGDLDRIRREAPDIIQEDFDNDNLAKKYIGMYEKLIQ